MNERCCELCVRSVAVTKMLSFMQSVFLFRDYDFLCGQEVGILVNCVRDLRCSCGVKMKGEVKRVSFLCHDSLQGNGGGRPLRV